jgi:hypothetical protein
MIVAWQFVARGVCKKWAVPAGRYEMVGQRHSDVIESREPGIRDHPPYGTQRPSHRTYGTGPLSNRSLAINCQATIIESLRDKAQPKNPSQKLQTGPGSGLLVV